MKLFFASNIKTYTANPIVNLKSFFFVTVDPNMVTKLAEKERQQKKSKGLKTTVQLTFKHDHEVYNLKIKQTKN